MHVVFDKLRNDYGFPDVRNTSVGLDQLRVIPAVVVSKTTSPQVAILLCTYQGKYFLAEQLESIAQQTHKNWQLYVSDDGDCEVSISILNQFKSRFEAGRVVISPGPKKGFVANFLSLTCDASIDADYFSYSDQDDIWEKDKLERAINYLRNINSEVPSLYCSRTAIVDQNNKDIGLSPLFNKPPSFANALVQNIGGGNTMVFNRTARQLAMQAGPDVPVITHDWWLYLLVAGCDGFIKYDPEPSLRYRQHGSNLVGCNNTWRARLIRIFMLLQGRFKDYNDKNVAALRSLYYLLSPANQKMLDGFSHLKNASFFNRIKIFRKLKIYRQTIFGTLGLWVAIFLGKM
jgi:glycosyltransferase involved in cell wall biosynthesis